MGTLARGFVAPIFLYLLVEGFFKTSNRKLYLRRFLMGTGIMFVINIVRNVLIKSYFHPITGEVDIFQLINGYNIFLTLSLFFILFLLFEKWKSSQGIRRWIQLLWIGVTLFLLLFSEGGIYLLPFGLAFYFFKNDKKKSSIVILIISALLLVKGILGYEGMKDIYPSLYHYLTFDSQFMMVTTIFLIALYNGQRGGRNIPFEKQLFYLFYPIHLIVIYCISAMM